MRSFKTQGIIIKRRNFGEADRIITVFTKQYGKFVAKASGVRKITSRRSSHIELLNLSEMHFHKGTGMPVLTEVVTLENFGNMKEDLTTVGFAYHICELVDGLCAENQENEKVFYLLKHTLSQLSSSAITQNKETVVDIIHNFEVELLSLLGFWHVPSEIPTKRVNTQSIIENLLERKLKSKQLLSHFD